MNEIVKHLEESFIDSNFITMYLLFDLIVFNSTNTNIGSIIDIDVNRIDIENIKRIDHDINPSSLSVVLDEIIIDTERFVVIKKILGDDYFTKNKILYNKLKECILNSNGKLCKSLLMFYEEKEFRDDLINNDYQLFRDICESANYMALYGCLNLYEHAEIMIDFSNVMVAEVILSLQSTPHLINVIKSNPAYYRYCNSITGFNNNGFNKNVQESSLIFDDSESDSSYDEIGSISSTENYDTEIITYEQIELEKESNIYDSSIDIIKDNEIVNTNTFKPADSFEPLTDSLGPLTDSLGPLAKDSNAYGYFFDNDEHEMHDSINMKYFSKDIDF